MSIVHWILIGAAVWALISSSRRFSARGGHACKCRYVGRYQDRRTDPRCPVHSGPYANNNMPFGG